MSDTPISFEEEPPSAEEIKRRIDDSHSFLVSTDAAGVSGYAYASPFHPRSAYRWSTEVSIYLASRARGRGLGRVLLQELLDRLKALGFVNAFAGTTLPNDASVRLFESVGFKQMARWERVGLKLGRWHDVGWWQLQLQEPTVPPPALRI